MCGDQVEGLADAGQHAERQHIDLHDAERIDVILVPFDEIAVFHCRRADRNDGVQPVAGEHETADMLRQMARKTEQLVGVTDDTCDQLIAVIEAGMGSILAVITAAAAPETARQSRGDIFGEPERFADFANGAPRTIGNDRCGERRTLMAIAAIDVLNHFLAALMLEIDIDVGWLLAFGGDEAFEQQIDLGRIDGGDAECIADSGIRRRSPALTQDLLFVGDPHDVIDREKIGGDVQLTDQLQLFFQCGANIVRNAVGIAFGSTLPGEAGEMVIRRFAGQHRFIRIVITQLVERELDARGKAEGPGDRFRGSAKQAHHLGGCF